MNLAGPGKPRSRIATSSLVEEQILLAEKKKAPGIRDPGGESCCELRLELWLATGRRTVFGKPLSQPDVVGTTRNYAARRSLRLNAPSAARPEPNNNIVVGSGVTDGSPDAPFPRVQSGEEWPSLSK